MSLTEKLRDLIPGQLSAPDQDFHSHGPLLLSGFNFNLMADHHFVDLLDAGLSGSDHHEKLGLGEPAPRWRRLPHIL